MPDCFGKLVSGWLSHEVMKHQPGRRAPQSNLDFQSHYALSNYRCGLQPTALDSCQTRSWCGFHASTEEAHSNETTLKFLILQTCNDCARLDSLAACFAESMVDSTFLHHSCYHYNLFCFDLRPRCNSTGSFVPVDWLFCRCFQGTLRMRKTHFVAIGSSWVNHLDFVEHPRPRTVD